MSARDRCKIKVGEDLGFDDATMLDSESLYKNAVGMAEEEWRAAGKAVTDKDAGELHRRALNLLKEQREANAKKMETIHDLEAQNEKQVVEVAKFAEARGKPSVAWDYVIGRVAWITSRVNEKNKGHTSTEGKQFAYESEYLEALSTIDKALQDSILGTTLTKSKQKDEEFLRAFMSDQASKDPEIAKAVQAYRDLKQKQADDYRDVFGTSAAQLDVSPKGLPIFINPRVMETLGEDAWVNSILRAEPKGKNEADLRKAYRRTIAAASSKDGYNISSDIEFEFQNPKGYMEYLKASGNDTLSSAIYLNSTEKAKHFGIYSTIGNPNRFLTMVQKVFKDRNIPDQPSKLSVSSGLPTLVGSVKHVNRDLDKTLASWVRIDDTSYSPNLPAGTGTVLATKDSVTETIELTAQEVASFVNDGKLDIKSPAKKKALQKIAEERFPVSLPTRAGNGAMWLMTGGRPLINATRLGSAVMGVLGEGGFAAAAQANISNYNVLRGFADSLSNTFRFNRADRNRFAIELGGLSMDLQSRMVPAIRGLFEGTEDIGKRQKQAIDTILESSLFKAAVSNAYTARVKAFSLSMIRNLEDYKGGWNEIPEFYRNNLLTYGINEDAWKVLKSEYDSGHLTVEDKFAGGSGNLVNFRNIKDVETRRKFLAAVAQFQKITSGESNAVARSIIARGAIGDTPGTRGTLGRESAETIFSFMTWIMTVWGSIMKPYGIALSRSLSGKGVPGKDFIPNKRAQQLALLGIMMGAGYVQFQAKNMLREGEFEETTADNATSHFMIALGYSGIGGLFTTLFLDPYGGELGFTPLAGNPSAGVLTKGVNLGVAAVDEGIEYVFDEDYEKSFKGALGNEINDMIRGVAPNIWYVEAATDRYGYKYWREWEQSNDINQTNLGL